jgi:hypothetical protein
MTYSLMARCAESGAFGCSNFTHLQRRERIVDIPHDGQVAENGYAFAQQLKLLGAQIG